MCFLHIHIAMMMKIQYICQTLICMYIRHCICSVSAFPNAHVCVFCVLKVATVPSAQSLRLLDFSFSDFDLSDTETTLATIRMFVDLNLVQNFQMKYTVRTEQLGICL